MQVWSGEVALLVDDGGRLAGVHYEVIEKVGGMIVGCSVAW